MNLPSLRDLPIALIAPSLTATTGAPWWEKMLMPRRVGEEDGRDQVAAGEEVEITKHGRTVARLVPARGPHALKGSLVGVAMTAGQEEDLFTTGATWELR